MWHKAIWKGHPMRLELKDIIFVWHKKINVNKKNLQGKVLNNSTAEQVYNPEKYQIMNAWGVILSVLCGVPNHHIEKWPSNSNYTAV